MSNIDDVNEQISVRLKKSKQLKIKGYEVWASKYEVDNCSRDIIENFKEMQGEKVKVAGRIMSLRVHGNACFVTIQDMSGTMQGYFRADNIGHHKYGDFIDYVDIGDIIGLSGEIFKTKKGEISIRVKTWNFLAKSLRPMPEKWHGLHNTDLRYRNRYIDLIVNKEVKNTFLKRSKIIGTIRHWLDKRNFIEVETPMLHSIAGGAAASPFTTHHRTLDMKLYLRIAPELYLKRLIVGGFERIYELNRNFRNEGISIKHNPEFSMIEIYQAYVNYEQVMKITENIISDVAQEVLGTTRINYQGKEIELQAPWRRLSMIDAVKEYVGEDFNNVITNDQAHILAEKYGVEYKKTDSKNKILNLFFEHFVEKHLIQPTFIVGYPTEISPLAKANKDNPEISDRFESFIFGWEIANGFSELNDPIDQKKRFINQMEQREQGDKEAMTMDEDFIKALEYGLPPTGGLGIGIDRLVMILTNSASIRDVIFFPQMRLKNH